MKKSNKNKKSGLWPAALLALLVMASIFLVPGTQAEAAGNGGKMSFTIDQVLEIKGSGLPREAQQFSYLLETIESGNPLPDGNDGGSYSFIMTETESITLEELQFTHPGEYRYRLALKEVKQGLEYQCDEVVYDITVYVYQRSNGELMAAATATNQTGDKCDSLT